MGEANSPRANRSGGTEGQSRQAQDPTLRNRINSPYVTNYFISSPYVTFCYFGLTRGRWPCKNGREQ